MSLKIYPRVSRRTSPLARLAVLGLLSAAAFAATLSLDVSRSIERGRPEVQVAEAKCREYCRFPNGSVCGGDHPILGKCTCTTVCTSQ